MSSVKKSIQRLPLSTVVLIGLVILLARHLISEYVVVRAHVDPAYDLSDDRVLVGSADNVFFGKVLTQNGRKTLGGFLETQFSVAVVLNIKGSLAGEVTVSQMGGTTWYGGAYLVEGDKLIEPDKVYLLVTKFHSEKNWHKVTPVYGNLEVFGEQTLETLRVRFQRAYDGQVIPSPGR